MSSDTEWDRIEDPDSNVEILARKLVDEETIEELEAQLKELLEAEGASEKTGSLHARFEASR